MKPSKILFTEDQIQKRVEEIASSVSRDFIGQELSVVGLLEDSFIFMADLIRKIEGEVVCYFMKADIDEGEERIPGHLVRDLLI